MVLIERGHEVGGGEQRFSVGTIAEITRLGAQEGFVGLLAQGGRRFEVSAGSTMRPTRGRRSRAARAGVGPGEDGTPHRDRAAGPSDAGRGQRVRRERLARRHGLADDPVAAPWQLAAIAPVSSLDQVDLLRSASVTELLPGWPS